MKLAEYYAEFNMIHPFRYSTRAWIAAFVPLSLRERAGVRGFKKTQIVTVPSREGNGRVQRLFFEHLAAYNGYALDWSPVSQDEWIQANIDGFQIQYQSLTDIFRKVLS